MAACFDQRQVMHHVCEHAADHFSGRLHIYDKEASLFHAHCTKFADLDCKRGQSVAGVLKDGVGRSFSRGRLFLVVVQFWLALL